MDPKTGGMRISAGFLMSDEKTPRIAAVQKDSPAEKAGLEAGDQILRIFSKDVSEDPDAMRIVARALDTGLMGKVGTVFPLEVRRGDRSLEIEMVLEKWNVKLAYDLGVRNGVAHIALTEFGPGAAEHVADILSSHLERGPVVAVLIDLRGNPGGAVKEMNRLASMFVSEGTVIARTTGRNFFRGEDRTDRDGRFTQIERVGVIIDGESASASESFAAFVRDHGLGPVAGRTSYGKGSQQAFSGPFGMDPFRITVARFTGPAGAVIDGEGVSPSIEVRQGPDGKDDWQGLIDRLRAEIAR